MIKIGLILLNKKVYSGIVRSAHACICDINDTKIKIKFFGPNSVVIVKFASSL